MTANRKQDEIFLAPETGIWLVFAARAVPGRGFDGAPLSAASRSRLATWLAPTPRPVEAPRPAARIARRVRSAFAFLFTR
ncbi:MAG: hypothetical protein MUF79_07045 [Burkholderiales bacterium]|jgi:hypothetical protein|nr:hypothetical protein [Burkholderiales bacterium]